MAIRQASDLNAYINPPTQSYLTMTPFTMPTAQGAVHCISMTSRHAQYLISAYGLLVFMICSSAWQFAIYLILLYYPTEEWSRSKIHPKTEYTNNFNSADFASLPAEERKKLLKIRKRKSNRFIALVAVRNSGSPVSAVLMLAEHAFFMFFKADDRSTGIYDTLVLVAALMVAIGSTAAATLIPRNLQVDFAAPVNATNVFFPMPMSSDSGLISLIMKTKAAGTQRALGVVQAAGNQLRKRVTIHDPELMDWTGPEGEPVYQTRYSYNVTGVDLGLQHRNSIGLVMAIEGACTLEYGWFNATSSNETSQQTTFVDYYDIPNYSAVYIYRRQSGRPVGGQAFIINSDVLNMTYTIMPDTVDRYSSTEAADPWYKAVTIDPVDGPVIVNGRPPLSCWQGSTWSYGGTTTNITGLGDVPGLNLPQIILDYLVNRMAVPMIVDVAQSLGNSVLVSSASSAFGAIDASKAGYVADLERLIFSSFVTSQNIFRDSAMVSDTYGLHNNATDNPEGLGKFVISSGAVVALSVNYLIWVPAVWLFLHVVRAFFSFTKCTNRNSGGFSRFTLRLVGLSHVQLFRLQDEEVCGYRNDWYGRRGHMPYIKEACEVQTPNNTGITGVGKQGTNVLEKEISGSEITRADSPATNTSVAIPRPTLFIAPKVVQHHGVYQLRLTGPMPHQKASESLWSWHGRKKLDVLPVADNPEDYVQKPETKTWAKVLWGGIIGAIASIPLIGKPG